MRNHKLLGHVTHKLRRKRELQCFFDCGCTIKVIMQMLEKILKLNNCIGTSEYFFFIRTKAAYGTIIVDN